MKHSNRNIPLGNNSNEEIISIQEKSAETLICHFISDTISENNQNIKERSRKMGSRMLVFMAEILLGIFDTLNPGLGIRYLLS